MKEWQGVLLIIFVLIGIIFGYPVIKLAFVDWLPNTEFCLEDDCTEKVEIGFRWDHEVVWRRRK